MPSSITAVAAEITIMATTFAHRVTRQTRGPVGQRLGVHAERRRAVNYSLVGSLKAELRLEAVELRGLARRGSAQKEQVHESQSQPRVKSE